MGGEMMNGIFSVVLGGEREGTTPHPFQVQP